MNKPEKKLNISGPNNIFIPTVSTYTGLGNKMRIVLISQLQKVKQFYLDKLKQDSSRANADDILLISELDRAMKRTGDKTKSVEINKLTCYTYYTEPSMPVPKIIVGSINGKDVEISNVQNGYGLNFKIDNKDIFVVMFEDTSTVYFRYYPEANLMMGESSSKIELLECVTYALKLIKTRKDQLIDSIYIGHETGNEVEHIEKLFQLPQAENRLSPVDTSDPLEVITNMEKHGRKENPKGSTLLPESAKVGGNPDFIKIDYLTETMYPLVKSI